MAMDGTLKSASLLAVVGAVLTSTSADAHVSIVSGPARANTSQEIEFGIGHGCDGADTIALTVEIPEGVSSVRPGPNNFGGASVVTDDSGNVTSITWQKAEADILPADTNFYKLTVRMRIPDVPLTSLYFPAVQTCRDSEGVVTTVEWTAVPSDPEPDGGVAPEPASELVVVPSRLPGWNKYVVTEDTSDLEPFFQDALIVWRGNAAYSFNPNTAELIGMTEGVTALTELSADDEIWVKY